MLQELVISSFRFLLNIGKLSWIYSFETVKSPFPKSTYNRNAEIYKILANPKRLEILNLLKNRELSVEQIVRVLKARKANVSQHLSLLRHSKLVKVRREGLNAFYTITNPKIVEPCKILHVLWRKR